MTLSQSALSVFPSPGFSMPNVRQLYTFPGKKWAERVRLGDGALAQDFPGPLPGGPLWNHQDDLRRVLDLVNVLGASEPNPHDIRKAAGSLPGLGEYDVTDIGVRNPDEVRWRDAMRPARNLAGRRWAPFREHPGSVDWVTAGRLMLAEYLSIQLAWTTYVSYTSVVRVHLAPGLGQLPLARLSPQHVQAFLNAKSASRLSPRTVGYLRAVLRQALGQAERWGMVTRNVARLAEPPRIPRREVRPFSPKEARRFLEVIRGDRLEALYLVALAVGLRQGEILGLAWSDVDFEASTLTVRSALQRIDGALALVEPKSATSRRVVALPTVVVDALRAHRLRQRTERLLAGSRWRDDPRDLVFRTTVGTPMDGIAVTRRFQAVLVDAGLPRQRFHDLRHACASLLLAQGVAPRVVMETLGHSQIGLTLNTYSHVIPALGRAAADQMDAVLGPRPADIAAS